MTGPTPRGGRGGDDRAVTIVKIVTTVAVAAVKIGLDVLRAVSGWPPLSS